jgi:hypothetical protein
MKNAPAFPFGSYGLTLAAFILWRRAMPAERRHRLLRLASTLETRLLSPTRAAILGTEVAPATKTSEISGAGTEALFLLRATAAHAATALAVKSIAPIESLHHRMAVPHRTSVHHRAPAHHGMATHHRMTAHH